MFSENIILDGIDVFSLFGKFIQFVNHGIIYWLNLKRISGDWKGATDV
jgi:hypothetical protein